MAFSLNPASILGPEFYGFLLPWLFTFAIVYGLLSTRDMFGKKSDKINLALAFVIAFFVTGAAGPQLAAFFINLFGGASVYLAGILVIILFLSLIGYDMTKLGKGPIYVLVVIIIGIMLFLGSTGTFVGQIYLDSSVAALAFWLVIIVIAVYLITKPDGAVGGGDHH
ncbi:MAG: hypothetical protein J4400_00065 [Candidatus Aenigmarchaeota archaeon]|nr:hypothetical protein [Candidatus Aenigmarchaeota archaeon]